MPQSMQDLRPGRSSYWFLATRSGQFRPPPLQLPCAVRRSISDLWLRPRSTCHGLLVPAQTLPCLSNIGPDIQNDIYGKFIQDGNKLALRRFLEFPCRIKQSREHTQTLISVSSVKDTRSPPRHKQQTGCWRPRSRLSVTQLPLVTPTTRKRFFS